ncbi:Gluconate 2-dehydrogenase subunit 3 OS=Afipia felis OX=1035 GN=BN961_00367 PE=4 SV=1 [Afipia felis]
MTIDRRQLLASAAYIVASLSAARASPIMRHLPWSPNGGNPPKPFQPGPWHYFTGAEGRTMEAIADRIIPPDPDTPGGKDAGCAVFVDRQLAGPYGRKDGHYNRPPFMSGTKQQGEQDEATPAQQYRKALAALDQHCQGKFSKPFAELSDDDKDAVLHELESGNASLDGIDGKAFFELVLKDIQTGFFADPLYGGNRDMVAWKMIGYPGARYNYLDWIDRHNERFPLPPVGLTGRIDWTPKG